MSRRRKSLTETMAFDASEIKAERITDILQTVNKALQERGYQSVNQISGYLISNDPAYISSHNDARNIIQEVERYEIIEELVRFYLDNNEK